ncbi:hypothetical protein [Alicyclobacillus kakegawensis]|uniref:hypothetical protein n=1 Tax=Alicyclobacillus kakegawensis TaxID=392012 RepID=UPI00083131CA|nr:hypothetical protein [Alicyclobacillus kakegawensis]
MSLFLEICAVIRAGNGPDGFVTTNYVDAVEYWLEMGGHFLQIVNDEDNVYLVASTDHPLTTNAHVREYMDPEDPYPAHPSADIVLAFDD